MLSRILVSQVFHIDATFRILKRDILGVEIFFGKIMVKEMIAGRYEVMFNVIEKDFEGLWQIISSLLVSVAIRICKCDILKILCLVLNFF